MNMLQLLIRLAIHSQILKFTLLSSNFLHSISFCLGGSKLFDWFFFFQIYVPAWLYNNSTESGSFVSAESHRNITSIYMTVDSQCLFTELRLVFLLQKSATHLSFIPKWSIDAQPTQMKHSYLWLVHVWLDFCLAKGFYRTRSLVPTSPLLSYPLWCAL